MEETQFFVHFPKKGLKKIYNELKRKLMIYHIIKKGDLVKVFSKEPNLIDCLYQDTPKVNFHEEIEIAKQNGEICGEKINFKSKILEEALDNLCCICNQYFYKTEKVAVFPCKHLLHMDCAHTLANYTLKCPVCRSYFIQY